MSELDIFDFCDSTVKQLSHNLIRTYILVMLFGIAIFVFTFK